MSCTVMHVTGPCDACGCHDCMCVCVQSTMSEEYGSENSTNGEQENDQDASIQKSPAPGEKSPGHSSSSSTHADDEGDSPCSSSNSSGGGRGGEGGGGSGTPRAEAVDHRLSSNLPQHLMRVSKDAESTCARTDLIYVPPSPTEKELATSTVKVHIACTRTIFTTCKPKLTGLWLVVY